MKTSKRIANELKGISYQDALRKPEYHYDLETIAVMYLEADELDYEALTLIGYTLVNNHFEGCVQLAMEKIVYEKEFNKSNPLKFRQVIKDTERFLY